MSKVLGVFIILVGIFTTNVKLLATNLSGSFAPESIMATSYFQSVQDGYWHQAASWDGAGIPPTSGTNNLEITINNVITYDGTQSGDPMEFQNNFTITVKSGAVLEIYADINITNNFAFYVEAGGLLIIHGSMSMGNVIEGVIDGAVDIDGDLDISGGGSSSITGTGTLEVGGTVTDPNGIVLPTLINNERYLVVDGGAWTDQNSWSATSGGTAGATIPSDQSKVFIESGFDVTIPSTVLLQDITISLGSVVTVSPGATLQVTNITNNGEIILSSDATGTGAMLYNGSTPGIVSFFRYVPAGKFQYVSSPYTDAPYTDYYTTIYNAVNPNFYNYDETNTGSVAFGWTPVTSGIIESGVGYALYYDRNYSYPLTGTTLRTGDLTVNVTNTSSGNVTEDGWNLLGNPYPANIDADAFLNANNSGTIEGTIYYWDDDGSNGTGYVTTDYSTYTLAGGVAGDNGTVPNGFIAPGQAFFIKATANGTVTFNDGMKAATQGTIFKSTTVTTESKNTELRLTLTNNNGGYNETLIVFADGYTENYDNFYDGRKKFQGGIAFYSLLSNENLAIQALPAIMQNTEVSLGLVADVIGTYTINAKDISNFDILVDIYLYDKQLDILTNLRKSSYTFSASGTINDRFAVQFTLNNQVYTTWQGGIDDNFFDETKWSNGLPSEEKSVIIPEGKVAKLNGLLRCRDLLIEKQASLVLEGSSYLDIQDDTKIMSGKDSWGIILDSENTKVDAKLVFDLDNSNFNNFSTPLNNIELLQVVESPDALVHTYATLQNKWNDITNFSGSVNVGDGYQVLPNSYILDERYMAGTLNTGNYNLYLNKGFNYVGNPYLSYIDWADNSFKSGAATLNDISGSFWTAYGMSDQLNNTSFGVYNRAANVSINGADRNIKPMQAFWIYANSEAELSLSNNMRKITPSESGNPNVNGLRLTVSGNTAKDETIVAFSNQATDGYDNFDSYKMLATDKSFPQLYSVADYDKNLAINTMLETNFENDKAVNLIFTSGVEGTYTIYFGIIGDFRTDVVVSITDEFGVNSVINENTPYSFDYTDANFTKNFTLSFEKKSITSFDEHSLENISIYSYRKDVYIQIPSSVNSPEVTIYDLSGRLIISEKLVTGENTIKLDAEGEFLIRLNNSTETISKKVLTW